MVHVFLLLRVETYLWINDVNELRERWKNAGVIPAHDLAEHVIHILLLYLRLP